MHKNLSFWSALAGFTLAALALTLLLSGQSGPVWWVHAFMAVSGLYLGVDHSRTAVALRHSKARRVAGQR
ncbi:hypothetical protein GC722_02190 [Auraticoccus sp. F435]|uniref:Uncharacterized protein n=1 Tax=Auraticoccus cholistanensis TaxID=2656650 RepID=A0A6A9UPN3_9ACTN|nr:hypothetical protein [Auraticoccus cholistanensis]MVA74846.1 hypothetical protein [Auraticoccus cholistanensis]